MSKIENAELMALVQRMREFEATAYKQSMDEAAASRLAGYFSGLGSGISFVVGHLLSVLEDNQ